ncbi:hypothetical protein [Pseudoxanthomonas sp. PXM02]|uniref:hypothetical protein n=1 Tax=Pseudoxanthomonas sp. PXM02 TaxID=2769294 RepID=UPI00177C907D|nr:hypothetical protein [Pseudoxanthomonas sp. PXM02]MBD9477691.1 hypothetical protein [Pseudoxanthomonas sp. PXM02]
MKQWLGMAWLCAIAWQASAQTVPEDALTERRAEYVQAIHAAIGRHWTRPPSAMSGVACPVFVRQQRSGRIERFKILPDCPYDAAARQSVEDALVKVGSLPYLGYEVVFVPELKLVFRASDNVPRAQPPPPSPAVLAGRQAFVRGCLRHWAVTPLPAHVARPDTAVLSVWVHLGFDGRLYGASTDAINRADGTSREQAKRDEVFVRALRSLPPCQPLPSEFHRDRLSEKLLLDVQLMF